MTSSTRGVSAQQQEQAALRRRERRQLGLVALAVLLLVVGGGMALQQWRTGRAPMSVPATTSSSAPVTITDGKPIMLGQAGAPVRVQLYEDFHCPHCADLERKLGSTISAELDAGHLAVELYPMSFIDAGSAAAANAMACAAENGLGQAYYQALFANSTLRWDDEQLVQLAGKVSTEVPKAFSGCVRNRGHQSWVDSINATAAANGIDSTPTMFLEGRKLDHVALTPDQLRALVDEAAAR